jgi:hypothetical protein
MSSFTLTVPGIASSGMRDKGYEESVGRMNKLLLPLPCIMRLPERSRYVEMGRFKNSPEAESSGSMM